MDSDPLLFIICRSKKWKSLDMVPMKMGKNNIDNILAYPMFYDVLPQFPNSCTRIKNYNSIGRFTVDANACGVSTISLKFFPTHRNRTPNTLKFYFHNFNMVHEIIYPGERVIY